MSSKDALAISQQASLSQTTLLALTLQQQPFVAPDQDVPLFEDDTTAEQLADIKQALITGDDMLLVVGENGAGKTTLLRQLGENSGLRIQCFAVSGSERFNTQNLFAGMLEAFKQPPPEQFKDTLDDLIPCLQTMIARNTLCTVVVDDAQRVTDSELTQLLSCMLYLNSQDETLIRLLLSADAEFEAQIPDLLPEGADLPYSSLTIEGMNDHRASHFLAFKLEQAGFQGDWPFSDHQIDDMVSQSGGMPGPLQMLAARHLNYANDPDSKLLIDDNDPLANDSPLSSRVGKFAMGAVATLCIGAGLLMFLPAPDSDRTANLEASEAFAINTINPDTRLEMLNDEAEQSSQLNTNASGSESTDPLLVEAAAGNVMASQNAIAEPGITFSADDVLSLDPNEVNDAPEVIVVAGQSEGRSTLMVRPLPTEPLTEDRQTTLAAAAETSQIDTQGEQTATTTEVANAALVQPAATAVEPNIPVSEADTTATIAAAIPATNDPETLDPALIPLLESPSWILLQDNSKYTVQMSASRDRASVENFLKRNAETLPPPNSIYTFARDGDTWFALVHGLFDSISSARLTVESMPASATTNQPWIRSVGRLQDVLRDQ